MSSSHVESSSLRREFSDRLSALYAEEVPLYGQLIEAVKQVNRKVITSSTNWAWPRRILSE